PLEYPLRTRHRVAIEVEPRKLPASFTPIQRLGLSAYFIRCEKYREAQQVLEPLIAKDRDNFVALSNLAMAYQRDRADEAIAHLKHALRVWRRWANLTKAQRDLLKEMRWDEERLEQFKTAETYQLKLLELRRKEPPKQPNETLKPDNLFGDPKDPLQFVGESGKFEPGKLAARELKKLPGGNVTEAIRVVQQLVLWQPNDARLLWQLGELYNARGDRVVAHKIFDSLGGFGGINFRPALLREHREALKRDLEETPPAPPKIEAPPGPADAPNDPAA